MIHRRRASPLHAARAVAGSAWCLAIAVAVFATDSPVLIGALLATVLAAAAAALVLRDVLRVALIAFPFALVIMLVNALVSRDGVTVLLRLGELPPFGRLDVTLEAVAYGAILGLRAIVVMAAFALHSAAVDPDDLLRGLRRHSFRGGLTAALATRMVPVLARDGRRLADALRCRPGSPPSRVTLLRALTTGALDRAGDVAATLEVRGYGLSLRTPAMKRPWSRHDLGFLAAAAGIVVLALAGLPPAVAAVACAAVALAPFLDRRGIA